MNMLKYCSEKPIYFYNNIFNELPYFIPLNKFSTFHNFVFILLGHMVFSMFLIPCLADMYYNTL